MDVKTDHEARRTGRASVAHDRPATTGQFPAVRNTSYDDTDQLPAVRRVRYRSGGTRVLRVAIGVVVVAILLAAAGLGLVKSGVFHKSSGHAPKKTATQPTTAIPADKPLLTQTSTTATSATYSIPVKTYSVTVTTSTGRSWVSISMDGAKPVYAGILAPNQSQHQVILGAADIDVGAGGTSVTVTAGSRTQVLKPLAAPFSYIIAPAG